MVRSGYERLCGMIATANIDSATVVICSRGLNEESTGTVIMWYSTGVIEAVVPLLLWR